MEIVFIMLLAFVLGGKYSTSLQYHSPITNILKFCTIYILIRFNQLFVKLTYEEPAHLKVFNEIKNILRLEDKNGWATDYTSSCSSICYKQTCYLEWPKYDMHTGPDFPQGKWGKRPGPHLKEGPKISCLLK